MATSPTTRRRHWGTDLPRSDPSSLTPVVCIQAACRVLPEQAKNCGHPRPARTASDLGTRRLTPARNDLLGPGYPWWDSVLRKIGGGRCPLTPTGAGKIKILPLPRRTQGWSRHSGPPAGQASPVTGPRHRSGQGSLPRACRGPSYRVSSRAGRPRSSVQVAGLDGRMGSVLGERVTVLVCLTCLLAQPQAPGIPGAGPGRWPARPP